MRFLSSIVVLCAVITATEIDSTQSNRRFRHSTNKPHSKSHSKTHPSRGDDLVDFSMSCVYEGTTLRNRQTKQIAGMIGHKGSIYAVCLDGKLVCHEETGIADTPALVSSNCSGISYRRRLGLMVESPQLQTWPSGVMCYKIATNFTGAQLTQIQHAMDHIKLTTNIRFLEIDACSGVTVNGKTICGDCKNYANINNWDNGCYAGVGYQNAGPQAFNLHPTCFDDLTGTGRIVHEFGHAIGLYHEHSHPSRTVVVIPGELQVSRNNYQVIKTATQLPYHPSSIMHYGSSSGLCIPKDTSIKYCDESQSPASDNCIIPTRDICDEKASEKLGQRLKFSASDLESIKKLYGNVKLSSSDEISLETASKKVSNVPTQTSQSVSTLPKQEKSSFFSFLSTLTSWISL